MVAGSPISQGLQRARSTARVAELLEQVTTDDLQGLTGIAHTRWATHGEPAVRNAHPHFSYGPGETHRQRQARPCGTGAQRHH